MNVKQRSSSARLSALCALPAIQLCRGLPPVIAKTSPSRRAGLLKSAHRQGRAIARQCDAVAGAGAGRLDVGLLGKRADWVSSPGRWSFPAGFVERGEVVEHAAQREAREETGLTVTVGPLLGVFSEPDNPVVLAVYATTDLRGDLLPGDDLTDLGWFALDALPDLAFDHDRAIITTWQRWRGSRAA